MSHPLVPDLIEILEEAAKLDFRNAPAMQFMVLVRDKLQEKGFSTKDAETIVSGMEIEIPFGAVTVEELETLSNLYRDILLKAHEALVYNNFVQPMTSLLTIAKQFSLKLS